MKRTLKLLLVIYLAFVIKADLLDTVTKTANHIVLALNSLHPNECNGFAVRGIKGLKSESDGCKYYFNPPTDEQTGCEVCLPGYERLVTYVHHTAKYFCEKCPE